MVNFTKCLYSACHIQYRETCNVSCREVVNPVWKQSEGTIALLPRGWWMSNRSVLKQVCLGVHELAASVWFCQKRKIKAKFLWGEILREKMLLNRRGYYLWHRSCRSSPWFMQICGQIQVSPSVVLINKKKKKNCKQLSLFQKGRIKKKSRLLLVKLRTW